MKEKYRLSWMERFLLALTFIICLIGAILLPMNQCPDEEGRMLVSRWIYEKGTLPTGNEIEVIIPGWGFSYVLRPFLSSIIGALLMRLVSLFTISEAALLTASRMPSVLAVTCCCYFCLRLGHRLFRKRSSAVLMAVLVCYLPQVMFLGMYQNCDSLGLATVGGMLTAFVEGYDHKWRIRDCIYLGLALAAAFLSYYSVYAWILMTVMITVIAVLSDSAIADRRKVLIRGTVIVAGICLVCAGWFFIRNAVLHEGDFLGLSAEQTSREAMRLRGADIYQCKNAMRDGESVWDFIRIHGSPWLRLTLQSFIGVFGYMNIFMRMEWYGIYYAVFIAGAIFFLIRMIHIHPTRKERLWITLMLASVIISFGLHFWQSYSRDYQAQGRYVEAAIYFVAYMLAAGLDSIDLRIQRGRCPDPERNSPNESTVVCFGQLGLIVIILWLFMFFRVAFSTMTLMIP